MRDWTCSCGWKTTSARGYKEHIKECLERCRLIKEAEAKLDNSLLGGVFRSITGRPLTTLIKK